MATATLGRNVKAAHQDAVLQDQFCLPRGPIGWIVGWFMARSNERMNRMAIDVLKIAAGDDVLEIGFGPGQAIELLVQWTAARFIAGIDPSDVMVDQAIDRNHESIETGRVQLQKGTAESIPYVDGRFSKIFAVSNFQIWASPGEGLSEAWRVLRPEGLLVLCLRRAARQPRWYKSPGASPSEITAHRQMLADHGFRSIKIVERRLGRRVICLVAKK
jgi:SAM-dependent methyltransferase